MGQSCIICRCRWGLKFGLALGVEVSNLEGSLEKTAELKKEYKL